MSIIYIYVFVGCFIAYWRFSYIKKIDLKNQFIINATFDKYKDQKYSNTIKKIIAFYNIRLLFRHIMISLSYIFFFPFMVAFEEISDKNKFNKYIGYLPHVFLTDLLFKAFGEIVVHKSDTKFYKNKKYHLTYTFSGKCKFYQNGKLHGDKPFYSEKYERGTFLSPAIKGILSYHKNGKTTLFPFNHKEKFFFEGNEIDKMTYKQYDIFLKQEKINNF